LGGRLGAVLQSLLLKSEMTRVQATGQTSAESAREKENGFAIHVSLLLGLQLLGKRGVTTMSGRPDELLGRSPGLIGLQTGRENSLAVHRAEWMHSPRS
jgi:hypothetical protein